MSFIDKLQSKPKSARVLILWISTFLVMIVIVAIWLFSFSKTLSRSKAGEELQKTNLPSLFESIGNDFSTFTKQFQSNMNNLEETISSSDLEEIASE